jgi:N-methylhydantoinase A
MLVIGVDSGGTFTDAVAVSDADGRLAVGKALSTPERPADGVVASIAAAAAGLGSSLEQILAEAEIIAHGTTVGLNALLTGRAAATGLLTTRGFEDTLAIARINKAHGLPEELETQATLWEKPAPLAAPGAILGVTERIDAGGQVITTLDEPGAREAIRALAGRSVDAIAVCLLWSFVNPVHELRLAELIREELGERIPVTLSCALAPRMGEYERTNTVMLNASLVPAVSAYLGDLERQLRDRGFRGSLLVMRSGGGVQPAAQLARRPVETLRSGPVGGLSGARALGARLGHENIICTDVGGTSFDVGLIVGGAGQYARRPMIGRYAIVTPLIDIESIGTGGGSIAWLDPTAGTLRVGPESAAASPGPVSYRRGGTRPTVTDAAVVLGYVDHLGGDLALDAEAAREAIAQHLATPLGLTIEEAAEGVLEVAAAQMADLIRRVTVQRGHDPADFALYAFGGAAPQYAGRYALELGISEVVVPAFASTFSAFGATAGDLRTTATLDTPRPFPTDPEWLDGRFGELVRRVRDQFEGPVTDRELTIERSLGLRFRRQVHELSLPVADGPVSATAQAELVEQFTVEYERLFGAGTAYAVAGVELVGLRADASLPLGVTLPASADRTARAPAAHRSAWFGGAAVTCPIYDGDRIAVGVPIEGPAFIEVPTTTTVVYPGQLATVDETGTISLRLA